MRAFEESAEAIVAKKRRNGCGAKGRRSQYTLKGKPEGEASEGSETSGTSQLRWLSRGAAKAEAVKPRQAGAAASFRATWPR